MGFTSYEANAPIVVKPTIRAGAEMRMPSPRRVDPDLVWEGKEDYQWVEVIGRLVERLALDSEHARYKVGVGARDAECTVVTSEGEALTPLVGGFVVIRAVPITLRTASGSILGLQFYVPSRGNIFAANRQPARAPTANGQPKIEAGQGLPLLTSAGDVKSLSHAEAARHYPVRIRAVVTFLNPDGLVQSCRITQLAYTPGLSRGTARAGILEIWWKSRGLPTPEVSPPPYSRIRPGAWGPAFCRLPASFTAGTSSAVTRIPGFGCSVLCARLVNGKRLD